MAAVVSPTPAPLNSTYASLYGRPSHRGLVRTASDRLHSRRPSPLAIAVKDFASSGKTVVGDSSDDEELAPIKLSDEAREILGEEASQNGSAHRDRRDGRGGSDAGSIVQEEFALKRQGRSRLGSLSPMQANGSPVPRVVRVGPGPRPAGPGTVGRDGSFLYKNHARTIESQAPLHQDSITPAPRLRSVRVSGSRSQTRSPPSISSTSRAGTDDLPKDEAPDTRLGGSPGSGQYGNGPVEDDHARVGPCTVSRSRRGDENGVQSTMRVKRIGAGTFLNGPVRRGMIRRQSEEDDVHQVYNSSGSPGNSPRPSDHQEEGHGTSRDTLQRRDDSPSVKSRSRSKSRPTSPVNPDFLLSSARDARPEKNDDCHYHKNNPPSPSILKSKATPTSNGSLPPSKSSSTRIQPVFKVPPLPPLPSTHDQENEPPPTFKRSKPSLSMLGEVQKVTAMADEKSKNNATPATISPRRQPLAPRSQNTPHRAAPPPPKMSILDAATSTAGSSRKKKLHISINNMLFTRLDCIGRGGSSRVYRVMAENYKIFAMKRVNLEDADSTAIAGYRGEIDLLKKLESVDRVVRLFDYEINDEKGTLSVLMEMGESDFNQMLNRQLKCENARLDVSFTRHYWKEMLECVQAVHDYDIVHSDLKPANFLLVQGRLKLIDFGIANAIQDNTVNVHRENQIGTPNYMSPESLVCHAGPGPTGTKLLKLGKPSDVWSLGCILYQMTYGQPPFAHIQKPFERIMSIPNPKVEIQFAATGVGGVTVPFGLVKTLRRCLQRDQILRPTITELLGEGDPFLHPVAISPDMLGRMISNVIRHCRKKEEEMRSDNSFAGKSPLPTDEDMRAGPMAFYEKLRQAQEDGTAW